MVNLLRVGAITPADMKDYCLRVNDKLDIFSNNSKAFSDEDMEITARYITENMPHDFVILDIDINTANPLARYALEKADLLIIAVTQMINVFERYNEVFGEMIQNKDFKNKAVYLCNQYTSEAGSVAAFAKSFGVKPNNCLTLHHSETLIKLSNNGQLGEFINTAKSTPLFEIEKDLNRIEKAVTERFVKQSLKPPEVKKE